MSERARAALALALCLGLGSPAAAQNTNTLTLRSTPSGGVPALAATGADINISINLVPKGAGVILFNGGVLPGTGTVTGSGTIGFLPRWTALTALGDSLLYQDTANVNVVFPGGATATDMAGFIGNFINLGTFSANKALQITRIDGFGPGLFFAGARGSYAAPTKLLAGDMLGDIIGLSFTGAASILGPKLAFYTLTDGDAASPIYRADLLWHSSLDTIRVGVNATPELEITVGVVKVTGTLNATVAYQANGTPGKTQAYVVCTGAACATACTLTFTQGILTGNAGTCP